MKIAICDDNINELLNTANAVKKILEYKQYPYSLFTFANGDDLLVHINKYGEFDLLILDILMPGLNGIELAQEVREKNLGCKIVFLTTSSEFAVNSYKVDALYYLLKPIDEKELSHVLDKAISQISDSTQSFVIKSSGKLLRIQNSSVLYIESVKHNILFHLKESEIIVSYGTLNEIFNILQSDKCFIRCHNSFIVNMTFIKSISSHEFILTDKTLIPISRQLYKQVKDAYIDFFFEKEIIR